MSSEDRCVEPKIGARIKEYIADVEARPGRKKLTIEESSMLEFHLLRCSFCRMNLDLGSRLHFETMLILTGAMIDDPVTLRKRRESVVKFFKDEMTSDEFWKKGMDVSDDERQKLKALWKKRD